MLEQSLLHRLLPWVAVVGAHLEASRLGAGAGVCAAWEAAEALKHAAAELAPLAAGPPGVAQATSASPDGSVAEVRVVEPRQQRSHTAHKEHDGQSSRGFRLLPRRWREAGVVTCTGAEAPVRRHGWVAWGAPDLPPVARAGKNRRIRDPHCRRAAVPGNRPSAGV